MESISKQSQWTDQVSSVRKTLLLVEPKKLARRASEVARVANERRLDVLQNRVQINIFNDLVEVLEDGYLHGT
jgi:hypothetical protein